MKRFTIPLVFALILFTLNLTKGLIFALPFYLPEVTEAYHKNNLLPQDRLVKEETDQEVLISPMVPLEEDIFIKKQ